MLPPIENLLDKLIIHKGGSYTGAKLSTPSYSPSENFILYQNYPNPFNPTTTINFSVPHLSTVSIFIFNIRGEFIEEVINDIYDPGNYTVRLNADRYANGIYLYRLATDHSVHTKKFIIIK